MIQAIEIKGKMLFFKPHLTLDHQHNGLNMCIQRLLQVYFMALNSINMSLNLGECLHPFLKLDIGPPSLHTICCSSFNYITHRVFPKFSSKKMGSPILLYFACCCYLNQ